MKAILFDAPGPAASLYIGEAPAPQPGPGEILVKVAAFAVNRADILQREGKYPPPAGASEILGLEIAGTVAATGARVSRWKTGERVFGLIPGGGYAEYAVIHQEMAMPLPDNLTFEQAAAIPEAFLTAFQALCWLGNVQPEENVLLHAGASGVGTAAIQLAAAMNAHPFVTASLSKLPLCLALGARGAFDRRHPDFWEEIREATGGVDVIIDPVGAAYFNENLKMLRTDGRLIILSGLTGFSVPQVNLAPVLFKRLQVTGSTLRSRSSDYQIRLTRSFRSFAETRLKNGTLRPVIDKVFGWTDITAAHNYVEQDRNTGKVVLKIS